MNTHGRRFANPRRVTFTNPPTAGSASIVGALTNSIPAAPSGTTAGKADVPVRVIAENARAKASRTLRFEGSQSPLFADVAAQDREVRQTSRSNKDLPGSTSKPEIV